jgi:hypothetical protein
VKTATRHPFGFDDGQLERYARHLILPEVGGRGQRALLDAEVRLDGDGLALIEALAFLAAAGVGRIALAGPVDAASLAHVAALNPDVALLPADASGPGAYPVSAVGTHADGALAALKAVLALVGRPETAWRIDPDIPGLSNPSEASP